MRHGNLKVDEVLCDVEEIDEYQPVSYTPYYKQRILT